MRSFFWEGKIGNKFTHLVKWVKSRLDGGQSIYGPANKNQAFSFFKKELLSLRKKVMNTKGIQKTSPQKKYPLEKGGPTKWGWKYMIKLDSL